MKLSARFILVVLGSLFALPVGLMAGIFLSEFASPKVAAAVRFAADILAGVPSIVVGVFAYAIVVRPMHSYSALSGGRGAGHHHDSRCGPDRRGVTASGAEFDARGGPGPGHHPVAGSGGSDHTGRDDRHCYRGNAGRGPHCRGNCAAHIHRAGQPLWLSGTPQADRGVCRCRYTVTPCRLIRTGSSRPGQGLFC